MGHDFIQPLVKGTLLQGFNRSKASRTAFIPVRYQNGMVEILEYHGSAHIYAFSKANGLLEIPAGVKEIKMGAEVDVRSL